MAWAVVGGSVTGRGHSAEGHGCQDAHCWRTIDGSIVVSVVCDGAGSHSRSAEGAQWVSRSICEDPQLDAWARHLSSGHMDRPETSWQALAQSVFSSARENLIARVSGEPGALLEDFSCTAILVLAGPGMVAVAHVGDGRACAKPPSRDWFPLFEPTRGAAANETIFLTTDIELGDEYWAGSASLFMGPIEGFALMSDGCEMGAFECWVPREEGLGFHDPNRPFAGFFDPLLGSLREMADGGMCAEEMERHWIEFLEKGVPRFSVESDDRTMIFGAWLPGSPPGA